MNKKEKRLLEELQFNFPITSRPYLEIGKRTGFSESGLLHKARALKKRGIIRYIGPVFNLNKMGFSSTLIAARVPESKIERAVRIINDYPQVSHNYLRDAEFNIWFTVTAPSRSRLLRIIREIKRKAGIKDKDILSLNTLKVFKIDARFKLSADNQRAV
ncbi:MAG: Lrp/AsnC family transcriptional regulator [Candidatus Omnitrophota bacterium]